MSTAVSKLFERDRGVADALGLVLIAPAMVGVAVLVVALGRAVDSNAQVRSAAEAAAQASALERTEAGGALVAERVVTEMLSDACTAIDVDTGWEGGGPSGRQAVVRVDCTLDARGLELVRRDAAHSKAEGRATIDPLRAEVVP